MSDSTGSTDDRNTLPEDVDPEMWFTSPHARCGGGRDYLFHKHWLTHPGRMAAYCPHDKEWPAAPIPATSGKTQNRHRLHRGGDRQANSALWRIALTRMSTDPDTRAYVTRRTQQGLSKREVMRCLKRYIARELYADLPQQMLA